MLTGTPLETAISATAQDVREALAQLQAQSPAQAAAVSAAAAASLPLAPFPLAQTFFLHSNIAASKVIYLDFDGFITRNTQWNISYNQPNIVTPPYDSDGDQDTFSDAELLEIQEIFERVSEDFRPFDVDVTTEDPGAEALRRGSIAIPPAVSTNIGHIIDGSSTVVSTLNFNGALTALNDINVTLNISHTADQDLSVVLVSPQGTRIQLFQGVGGTENDFLNTTLDDQAPDAITNPTATAPFTGVFRPNVPLSLLNGEDPNGIWLLEITDDNPDIDNGVLNGWSIAVGGAEETDTEWGVRLAIGGSDDDWRHPAVGGTGAGGIAFLNSFDNNSDDPAFVFSADAFFPGVGMFVDFVAETVTHEVGHSLGLSHDGLIWFWKYDNEKFTDPSHRKEETYYLGHGFFSGDTAWSPIMGAAAGGLTQWSFGEYPGANEIQDDLAIIVGNNGFGYLPDDHSDSIVGATPLELNSNEYFGEGIIGEHPAPGISDVDSFSFTVGGNGEFLNLDINPFQTSPNLDILAKLYDSAGQVIGTSNPRDFIAAGSQTVGLPNIDVNQPDFVDPELGWRVQLDSTGFVIRPSENGTWQNIGSLLLLPGTYYISVEGTGKLLTYIDPTIYPGPIVFPAGTPDPKIHPIDTSDYGYSNYGSLGYFSITGTREPGNLVGIDFDVPGGTAPLNWNSFTGSTSDTATLTDLINETGAPVPYTLTINSGTGSINTFGDETNEIITDALPENPIPLEELKGFISGQGTKTTFTWGGLEPNEAHTIYVFAHADFDIHNLVTVKGRLLTGGSQTISFEQIVEPDGLTVNKVIDGQERNDDLDTYGIEIYSDSSGNISIDVTNVGSAEWAVAGLAIAPQRRTVSTGNGSISGQKWNDLDGDHLKDVDEPGLAGWTVFVDKNNNGILDTKIIPGNPAVPPVPAVPGVTQTVHASIPVPLQIPDEDNGGITSSLNVLAAGNVTDIKVTVDITHSYISDLDLILISPFGTELKLFARRGFDGDNLSGTVFDDDATASIKTASAPYIGSFRPESPLGLYEQQAAQGTWTLRVKDHALGDFGTLNSWSITITDGGIPEIPGIPATPDTIVFDEPNTVTGADGTYSFTDLTPGLYNIREYFDPAQVTAGWTQTWAPTQILLTPGANIVDQDFGNRISTSADRSIQGQKFYDADQDGVKDAGEPGLPGWAVYVDQNNSGVRDVSTDTTTVDSTDAPKTIKDLTTIQSQLVVDAAGSANDVTVTLDITHSFVGDLQVHLTSPSGRRVELFSGVGGQYNNLTDLTFSDSANRSIDTLGFSDLPFTGTWKPKGSLSIFDGDDAVGIWTLSITDTTNEEQGVLNSWSLSFKSGELSRVTDTNGNYQFDGLSTGSYIIREEAKPNWTSVAPVPTTITAAVWAENAWTVTIPSSPITVINVDFGNYAALGAIAGFVYRDQDFDGEMGEFDQGLAGWTVFLDVNGNGELDATERSTVSDATGHYSFTNVYPYAYQVSVVQRSGWTRTDATGTVTLLPAQNLSAANIGERSEPGDFNFDGSIDSGDYLIWRRQNGTNVPAFTGADGDGDGDVDQGDYTIWTINFGGGHADSVGNSAAVAKLVTIASDHVDAFQTLGDTDWYRFNVTAGTPYQFNANFGATITLFDTNGTTQLLTNTSTAASGDYAFLQWTPTDNGQYFLKVQSTINATYPYEVRFAKDDYGNDAAHATLIDTPGTTTGSLEIYPDQDWFKFDATAGTQYAFSISSPNGGYIQILDTDGVTELTSGYYHTPPVFTAPADGTYFVVVSADGSGAVYHLTVGDDFGNTAASAAPIVIPSTTAGNIEAPDDVDWFSFVATSGTSYRFQTTLNTLDDSVLRVFAPNGTTELALDDDGGTGLASLIDWTAPTGGTYFVQVSGFDSEYGSYDLVTSINPPGSGSSALLAPAGAGLMMDTADASLLTSVQSVGSTDNSPLLAAWQGTSAGSAPSSTKPVSQARTESGARNDLALLAWLASSSGGSHSGAGEALANDDLSASRLSDEPESMDVAFELLEGNALASATI